MVRPILGFMVSDVSKRLISAVAKISLCDNIQYVVCSIVSMSSILREVEERALTHPKKWQAPFLGRTHRTRFW